MGFTDIEKQLLERNGKQEEAYAKEVNYLIRKKYSLDDELAISRQRDVKSEEWEAYYDYCEQCKVEARKNIYGG